MILLRLLPSFCVVVFGSSECKPFHDFVAAVADFFVLSDCGQSTISLRPLPIFCIVMFGLSARFRCGCCRIMCVVALDCCTMPHCFGI